MSQVKLEEKGFASKMGMGNTHPAVLAVWAALISVAHMLPSIPMLGTGGTFSVSAALIPLAGIFFGPFGGAICVAVGNFIGQIIAPHTAWLGLGTFIVGTINGFTTGCISRGKWPWAAGIILLGTIFWYTTAIGRQAPLLPVVFYGLGLIMAILGGTIGYKYLFSDAFYKKFIGIWLASFAGFAASASIANFLSIALFKLPATVWNALAVLAPIERAVFALGAGIIGVPLLLGLPKIGIFVGPDADLSEDEDE